MGVRLVRYNQGYGNGSGGGNGTFDHNELANRDLLDQHPIYAITGLEEALDDLNIYKQESNKKIENIINDITVINNNIESINQEIENANVIDNTENTNCIKLDYNENTKTLKAETILFPDSTTEENELKCLSDGLYVIPDNFKDTNTISVSMNKQDIDPIIIDQNSQKFSHIINKWENNSNVPEEKYWQRYSDKIVKINNISTSFIGCCCEMTKPDYQFECLLQFNFIKTEDIGVAGIILAHNPDKNLDNKIRTLCLLVDRADPSHHLKIYYNYNLPDETLVYSFPSNNLPKDYEYGNSIRFNIVKQGNIIKINSTSWLLDPDRGTEFEIDLSKYKWEKYFDKNYLIGYCNLGRKNVFYSSTIKDSNSRFSKEYKFDVNISKEENNSIVKNSDGIFSKKFLVSKESHNGIKEKDDGYYVDHSIIDRLSISNNQLFFDNVLVTQEYTEQQIRDTITDIWNILEPSSGGDSSDAG